MTTPVDLKNLNYYEQEPEDQTFYDIIFDITHRCNMECKNCYIPNRLIPDMRLEEYTAFIKRLTKKVMIRLVGAEPTLHPQLIDFINIAHKHGHRSVVITNGLRLASESFVDKLQATNMTHLCMSMNGVDRDDWYEEIDELRCADKKVKAFKNVVRRKFFDLSTGHIIVKGVNEDAPERMLALLDKEGVEDITLRIKNVGQLGRYMNEVDENIKLPDLISLTAKQLKVSEDWIWSHYGAPNRYTNVVEMNTIEFPLDPNNKERYSGRWVKMTDWNTDNGIGIPDPGNTRRGRITADWKVAPFYEHIKMNEGEY